MESLPKEIEITEDLALTDKDRRMLDMHSFLNILNVLLGELYLLRLNSGHPDDMAESSRMAEVLAAQLADAGTSEQVALDLEALGWKFEFEFKAILERHPEFERDEAVQESAENIRSVITILRPRIREWHDRRELGNKWVSHPVGMLQESFTNFFAAVEKNSKGRYRIVRNLAAQEERDYVVSLDFQPGSDGQILMPPVFHDVFRDLVANARKYTAPGGVIIAGLVDNNHGIRLAVEDTGRGIPPEELSKVIGFGYRASNVRDIPTKGAGFGLTKAYAATKQFGGRMWLRSQINVGTRVIIEVPRPS